MRGPPIFGTCPNCEIGLTPFDVLQARPASPDLPVRIVFQCDCGVRGLYVLSPASFVKLNRRWVDWQHKNKYSYDTEAVGRAVQGFRLELDAITTVEDIELYWSAEEAPREVHV